jgi:addiction module HigA family antidote
MAGDAPGFRPVHPGVIVKRNIDALGLTIEAFADHIGTSRQNVHAIIRGDRAVTPEMAARLGRAFDTNSRFWLNLQTNYDVWKPERAASVSKIRPFRWPMGKKATKGATGTKGTPSTMRTKVHRAKAKA